MNKNSDNFLDHQQQAHNSQGRQQDINNLLYMEDRSFQHCKVATTYADCINGMMDNIQLAKKAKPHERTLILDAMWDDICATNRKVKDIMTTPKIHEAHSVNLANGLS